MTLLITLFAAIFVTAVWYSGRADGMQTGILVFLYWGASIMWFVDAVAAYIGEGDAYFHPTGEEMANDAFLGFSVLALGLLIWIIRLLITDPRGRIRGLLTKRDRDEKGSRK